MQIAPGPASCPWPYEGSNLDEPKGALEFADVVGRMRRFRRDALMQIGVEVSWAYWRSPKFLTLPNASGQAHRIKRDATETLISLAAIFGSETERRSPTELDFSLLCWEIFSVVDHSLDSLKSDSNDFGIHLGRITKARPTFLARILPQDFTFARAAAFAAKMYAHHVSGRAWNGGDLIRPFLIAKEIQSIGERSMKSAYTMRERAVLLTTIEEYFRCVWVMLVLAQNGLSSSGPKRTMRLVGGFSPAPVARRRTASRVH